MQKVEIRWPDGVRQTVTLPGIDRYYAIQEGKGIVPSVYDQMVHPGTTSPVKVAQASSHDASAHQAKSKPVQHQVAAKSTPNSR